MSNTWKDNHKKLATIARKVISDVYQENIINIEKIDNLGEVNYILFVTTKNRKLVLRLNAEDGVESFQKEKWASSLAIDHSIQTPPILYVGEVDHIAVSILPYIEGVNGQAFANKKMIWEKLGEFTKRLHQIKVQGFGENLFEKKTHKFDDSWQRFVEYNIESLTGNDQLIELGVLNSKTSKLLKEIFIKLSNTSFKFGLSHGDLSEKNTIINSEGKVWLLDWGCVSAQVIPHFDFVGVLDWSLNVDSNEFISFLSGYGMRQAEFKEIDPQVTDFALLQATDKLRWAIDKSPDKIKLFTKRLKDKLEVRLDDK